MNLAIAASLRSAVSFVAAENCLPDDENAGMQYRFRIRLTRSLSGQDPLLAPSRLRSLCWASISLAGFVQDSRLHDINEQLLSAKWENEGP